MNVLSLCVAASLNIHHVDSPAIPSTRRHFLWYDKETVLHLFLYLVICEGAAISSVFCSSERIVGILRCLISALPHEQTHQRRHELISFSIRCLCDVERGCAEGHGFVWMQQVSGGTRALFRRVWQSRETSTYGDARLPSPQLDTCLSLAHLWCRQQFRLEPIIDTCYWYQGP